MGMCIGSDICSWEMYEWLWVCVNMWMCVFVLYMCFKCVWCKSMFFMCVCVCVWVSAYKDWQLSNQIFDNLVLFTFTYFISFAFIYFISFYFILFYLILFYFFLFYFTYFTLCYFCSIYFILCCFVFYCCLFYVKCIVYKGYISNRRFVYNESISVWFYGLVILRYFTLSSFILPYLTFLCLTLINYA